MFVSIIGTPASGKTTLFKALSGATRQRGENGHPSVRIEVPDERIDALTKIFNPRKTTYSRLDVTDTVAIREGEVKNETLDAKSLQQIRQSDAVLLVLRHFDNGHAADPVGDFQRVQESSSWPTWSRPKAASSVCESRMPSSPSRPCSRSRRCSSCVSDTSSRAAPWPRWPCHAKTTRRSAAFSSCRANP